MSQSELQGNQVVLEQALSVLRVTARSNLDTILPYLDQNFDTPLRMYASNPADANLNFSTSKVQLSDGTSKSIAPIVGAVPTVVASTINFQTQSTTGATFSVSFPASTVGQYRRAGFSLTTLGTIAVSFSAEAGTIGGLPEPGSLMATDSLPLGYTDLECTDVAGKFKTVGSSTNVIENSVSGTTRVFNFSGAGANPGTGSVSATYTATGGETIADRTPVYISLGAGDGGRTAGRIYKLDATNAQRSVFAGFTSAAVTAGNSVSVQYFGELTGLTGLTVGQQQYGSVTTPGALQTTAPATAGQYVVQVGEAISTTSLVINGGLAASAVLARVLSSATPQPIGITSSAGASQEYSDAGHVHGQSSEYDAGTISAIAGAINFNNGETQRVIVKSVTKITLSGGVVGNVYKLRLEYDLGAGYPVTFDQEVFWENDIYPGNGQDPYDSDIFYFYKRGDGSWLGTVNLFSFVQYGNALDITLVKGTNGAGAAATFESGIWLTWGGGQGVTLNGIAPVNPTKSVPVYGGRSFSVLKVSGNNGVAVESSTGNVYTWGDDSQGQLGQNDINVTRTSPVSVLGGRSFATVATTDVASFHSMAAIEGSTGNVWSWGAGNNGSLGDGTAASKSSPVSVVGGRSFVKIAVGTGAGTFSGSYVAIEGSTGLAWAWGFGTLGQMGENAVVNRSSPISVLGGRSYSDVTGAQGRTLVIEASTGFGYGWGVNSFGGLGDNTSTSRSSPVSIVGARSWSRLSTGGQYLSAGIEGRTGNLYGWGLLDDGTGRGINGGGSVPRSSPILLSSRSYSKLATGDSRIMAVEASTGTIHLFGNTDILFGYPEYPSVAGNVSSPVQITSQVWGGRSFSRFAFGASVLGFEASTGNAYGWGVPSTNAATIGDNDNQTKSYPSSVFGGKSFTQGSIWVFNDSDIATAIAIEGSTGTAWSWGTGASGQLGQNSVSNRQSPVSVLGGRSCSRVAAGGSSQGLIIANSGFAFCWGSAAGDNTGVQRSSPVSVLGARSFREIICAAADSIIAIEGSTGRAWAWGDNTQGILGDNTTTARSSPVSVVGARSFVALARNGQLGVTGVVALEGSTGNAYAWGSTRNGTSSSNNKSSPLSVLGGRSYTTITGGRSHTLAIEGSTGYIWAWGSDSSGQLGTGTGGSSGTSPVQVVGNRSYTQVYAGWLCSLAVDSQGIIYMWGANSGNFGNAVGGNAVSSPVSIGRIMQ